MDREPYARPEFRFDADPPVPAPPLRLAVGCCIVLVVVAAHMLQESPRDSWQRDVYAGIIGGALGCARWARTRPA